MASIYTEIQLEGDSDSIRILELAPLDPSLSTGALHGRLTRAYLHRSPDYTALSYVWGPPEFTHSIILNDSYTLPITETLFDALKELASDKSNAGRLSLWIDQVCINQTDDTEKASQVQMMSRIFRQANLVIGWLGPADTDSNEAMDLFRYFSLNTSSPEKTELGQDLRHRLKLEWTTDQEGRSVNHLEQERNSAGLACVALLYRPWFKRLWIVQELVLARKLELRCGSATISDSDFFTALESSEWKGPFDATIDEAFFRVDETSKTLKENYARHLCIITELYR
ncbi:hypothetical protein N0V85_009018 [Neurospora sp. IMI 360204]|nr:hypothetical protein N0V85_009018 [Neurospora sp. IMI 360204]